MSLQINCRWSPERIEQELKGIRDAINQVAFLTRTEYTEIKANAESLFQVYQQRPGIRIYISQILDLLERKEVR